MFTNVLCALRSLVSGWRRNDLHPAGRSCAENPDCVVRDAVAQERTRIARELHDSVGHRLVLIAMRARHANSDVHSNLRLIDEIVSEALSDMRMIVGSLHGRRPAEDRPLSSSVADIVARIPPDALSVSVETVGVEEEVPSDRRTAAIRVVEEGLTNAIKHAHRGNAEVSLQYRGDDLAVVVRSAARHRPPSRRDGGIGLTSLRQRVASCGGDFSHHEGPRGEFTVRAAFPGGDLPVRVR